MTPYALDHTPATQAEALRSLGITDDAIAAMGNQWPAGTPRDPACWNDYDKRCLPIFAANCLCSENLQDIRELEYLDFILGR